MVDKLQCDGTDTVCVFLLMKKRMVQCDGTCTKKCDGTYFLVHYVKLIKKKTEVQCDGTDTKSVMALICIQKKYSVNGTNTLCEQEKYSVRALIQKSVMALI